jgi:apolipoprotein N-acyltransferase
MSADRGSAHAWPRTLEVAAVFVGAVLHALALPPVDLSVAAWLALIPLLLVLRGSSASRGFALGVLYGCGVGWVATSWAASAVARYFQMGLPSAVLALTVFYIATSVPTFGVFGALAPGVLRAQRPWRAHVVLPALWVATELVRGRLVGQPWGLLGYSQHAHPGLIQVAAVTGVYGVSFVLVWGNTAIAAALESLRAGTWTRSTVAGLALQALVIGLVWTAGTVVAERGPTGGFSARPVAIVQTNLPPALHWTPAYADQQLLAHVHWTDAHPSTPSAALVVWPENAIPRYLETDATLAAYLGSVATQHHTDLLFGTPRYENGSVFNSVRLITADGQNGGHYDKQKLVLFAERSPFGRVEARPPAESPTRFTAGSEAGVLRSFVRLGISICHEIAYPELVSRSVQQGAELLVNVSNDGWLDVGNGGASRQHFAIAVFRAVETHRYLVRAATTGVSGVVDPYGHVLATLPSHTPGVITTSVAGRSHLTPYVRFGDSFALLCVAISAIAVLPRRRPVLAGERRPSVATTPSTV